MAAGDLDQLLQDESVKAAAKAVSAANSCLDVLVNNAGVAINYDLPPSRQRVADIQATYDVNVFGPIRVTQAFLPLLLAAPAARIVMVSSSTGSIGRTLDPATANHAVNMMGYGSSQVSLERHHRGLRQGARVPRHQGQRCGARLHRHRSQRV
ncbi:SDR family NAD(P)-dependent oxidoreductase [Mesorhizobium sp. M0244]|uniref:SDR family NAD(P)-dependent oxidoreductase n=1 Tax=Mesorhizobium sp. M0244 TaxID=2956926 RepID=UPI003334D9F6